MIEKSNATTHFIVTVGMRSFTYYEIASVFLWCYEMSRFNDAVVSMVIQERVGIMVAEMTPAAHSTGTRNAILFYFVKRARVGK